jgi:hypothetical protein
VELTETLCLIPFHLLFFRSTIIQEERLRKG